MGKRSAAVELFLGDMGSILRELRPSTQREEQLTMETKLEQIAVKAVNQLPKSVVREIRTPRSVGAGGGDPLRGPGGPTGRIRACVGHRVINAPSFMRRRPTASRFPGLLISGTNRRVTRSIFSDFFQRGKYESTFSSPDAHWMLGAVR